MAHFQSEATQYRNDGPNRGAPSSYIPAEQHSCTAPPSLCAHLRESREHGTWDALPS
jgi:hypothetical protein